MDAQVTNNEAASRYELAAGGATAMVVYSLSGDTLTFTHTEVPEELEGQGIGGRLIAGALDDVRRRGLKIVPACSFVRHYVETHPDTHDLLA